MTPSIGDKIKCCMTSTAAKNLTISSEKLTVEINFPGERVPCYLAQDQKYKNSTLEYLVLWMGNRWISVKHRSIKSCREIEDISGKLLTGSLLKRVNATLI